MLSHVAVVHQCFASLLSPSTLEIFAIATNNNFSDRTPKSLMSFPIKHLVLVDIPLSLSAFDSSLFSRANH